MVTVDGDVESEVFGEVVVIAEAKHVHVVAWYSASIPSGSSSRPTHYAPTKSKSLLIFGMGFPGLYTLR